jgi:hypothetical protein
MSDEIKPSTTVTTSENAAEFYAKKMDLAPVVTDEVVEPVTEVAEEVADPVVAEEDHDKPKNNKLEKRFSEITRQKNEAIETARVANEAKATLEARIKALEEGTKPKENIIDIQKPTPDQFTDAFEYAEKLAEYSANKALADRDKADQTAKEQARVDQVKNAWAERQKMIMAEHEDYEEVLAQSDAAFSDPVRDAIVESELGPTILYHLAQHPEIVEKINSSTIIGALRMIGRLEAQLEKPSDEKKAEKVVTKSKAPAPITPVTGNNAGLENLMSADGEFKGTNAEYRALRKAGKIK